jgi:hypothetical protein
MAAPCAEREAAGQRRAEPKKGASSERVARIGKLLYDGLVTPDVGRHVSSLRGIKTTIGSLLLLFVSYRRLLI